MMGRHGGSTSRYLLQAPALSSKPAARRCCCRSMGQTDGRDTRPLHRRGSACYAGSVDKSNQFVFTSFATIPTSESNKTRLCFVNLALFYVCRRHDNVTTITQSENKQHDEPTRHNKCRPNTLARVFPALTSAEGSIEEAPHGAASRDAKKRLGAGAYRLFWAILMTMRSWWRGSVVERRSLPGELSLSCARPPADG